MALTRRFSGGMRSQDRIADMLGQHKNEKNRQPIYGKRFPIMENILIKEKTHPRQTSLSQGLLQFSWRRGAPWFTFTANRETYAASMLNPGRTTDLVYLFYSCNSSQKKLVGKMKISSAGLSETESVLFATSSESQLQSPSQKKKGLFRSISQPKKAVSSVKVLYEARAAVNLELAAVVIRRQPRHEAVVGGWGLKFLPKPAAISQSSVVAIFPTAFHGGAVASLSERWRSPGCCDCGGWDLGCPIAVLTSKGGPSFEERDRQWQSPLELLPEGREKGRMIRIEPLQNDTYKVYSEGISGLQCFSTAVAVTHASMPALSSSTLCYPGVDR
ncbi:uncharacterized protein LOC144700204 [Wolffia australiana]